MLAKRLGTVEAGCAVADRLMPADAIGIQHIAAQTMRFYAHGHARANFIAIEGYGIGGGGTMAIGFNDVIRIGVANRQNRHVEQRRIAANIVTNIEGGRQIAICRNHQQFGVGIVQAIENIAPQAFRFQQSKTF